MLHRGTLGPASRALNMPTYGPKQLPCLVAIVAVSCLKERSETWTTSVLATIIHTYVQIVIQNSLLNARVLRVVAFGICP